MIGDSDRYSVASICNHIALYVSSSGAYDTEGQFVCCRNVTTHDGTANETPQYPKTYFGSYLLSTEGYSCRYYYVAPDIPR